MSPVAPSVDDAELVASMRTGDRDAFAALYDRYADRLHDFCRSMLRDDAEAADVTHDVFVYAAERIGELREPAKVRAWLYAIARHDCLRKLKRTRRSVGEAPLATVASNAPAPDEAAERDELAALVWNAAAGLSPRDQALLDLHVRQGLDGQELAAAIGESPSQTYVLLSRMRDQVERSIGALLVARVGRDDCADLEHLLHDWDGTFSVLWRKRVARHVDGCDVCSERRRKVANPLALFGGVPAFAAPLALRDRVLSDASPRLGRGGRRGRSKSLRHLERGSRTAFVAGGAAVLAIVVAVAIAAASLGSSSAPKRAIAVTPAQVTVTTRGGTSTSIPRPVQIPVATVKHVPCPAGDQLDALHAQVGAAVDTVTISSNDASWATTRVPASGTRNAALTLWQCANGTWRLVTVGTALGDQCEVTAAARTDLGLTCATPSSPTIAPAIPSPTTHASNAVGHPSPPTTAAGPPHLQFGTSELSWHMGDPMDQAVTVAMVGGTPGSLVHGTWTLTGHTDEFSLVTGACMQPIAAGDGCILTVRYQILDTSYGLQHATLQFHSANTAAPVYSLPLVGESH